MGSGKSLEFWDPRNSMMLQVMEKVNLCGQLRRGRRKQPQQNIFQASKNVDLYVLGLEYTENILMSHVFLNFKTPTSC